MSAHNLPMPPPLPPVTVARPLTIAKRNELAPLQVRSTAVVKSSNSGSNASSHRLSLPESTSGSASVSQSSTLELVEVVGALESASCAWNQREFFNKEGSLASSTINRNEMQQESEEKDRSTCTEQESTEQEKSEEIHKSSETRISMASNNQSTTHEPWLEASKAPHKDERRKTKVKAKKNSINMASSSSSTAAANANVVNSSFSITSIQPSISNTPHDRRLTSKVHRRSLSLAGVAANKHASNESNSSHTNSIIIGTSKVGNSSLTSSSPLLAAMTMTNRNRTRRHKRHNNVSNMGAGANANANDKVYNFQRSLFTLYIDDCGSTHEYVSRVQETQNRPSRQASIVNKNNEYSLTVQEQSSINTKNNDAVLQLLQQVAFTRTRYKKLKISGSDLSWALTLHQASSLRCDEGIFNVGTVHLNKIASLEEFEKDVQLIE